VTQRIGDADSKNVSIWLNSLIPAGDGELYAFGGWSNRFVQQTHVNSRRARCADQPV
jgi:hypothetical protein